VLRFSSLYCRYIDKMIDCVQKRQSKKSYERTVLATFIESSSIDVMPCSSCFKYNLACRIARGSSRCSECIRCGWSYDGSSVASACMCLAWWFATLSLTLGSNEDRVGVETSGVGGGWCGGGFVRSLDLALGSGRLFSPASSLEAFPMGVGFRVVPLGYIVVG
jgi:hypothetical protein